MKYENEKKLNSLITEIINNENQLLVDKLKELESWKNNNLWKIKEHDKLKIRNDTLQSHIEMLRGNIRQFMELIWATYHDESWVDWCSETGESWWEEIVFWKYKEKELSLTHNQVLKKLEEKTELKSTEVTF